MSYKELLVHWQVMLTSHLLSLWRRCFHSLTHSQISRSQSGCIASPIKRGDNSLVPSVTWDEIRLLTSSHPSIFSLVFLYLYVSIQIFIILVLTFIWETHLRYSGWSFKAQRSSSRSPGPQQQSIPAELAWLPVCLCSSLRSDETVFISHIIYSLTSGLGFT